MSRQKWRKRNGYRWGRNYSVNRHQRLCRVFRRLCLGDCGIHATLARNTSPGGPLGGNLVRPRNLLRNGRVPEAPPIVVHPEFVFALIGIDLDDMRKDWGSIPPLVLVQHGEARPIWDRGYLA